MLLAALAASAGLLGACDSADAVRPTPCAPGTPQVVVGECLLGLTVDSDSADVVRRLGPADRYLIGNEGFGLRYLDYFDHPVGGRVIVTLAPKGFFSVSISDGFTAVIGDGIGYGTPRAEVRRRLGRPIASAGGPGDLGFDRYAFPADSVDFQIGYGEFEGGPGVDGITLRSTKRIF